MTIFELREIALRYASQTAPINIGGTISYAMPDVVVGRAEAYLKFMTGDSALQQPKVTKKRR